MSELAPEQMGAPGGPPSIGPESPKRSRTVLIIIVLLSVALATALGFLAFYLVMLSQATALIEEQNRQLDEQRELIDKKETFGAAMTSLLDTARSFDGVLMTSIVPMDRYELTADFAYTNRWSAESVDRDIDAVRGFQEDLKELLAASTAEASTNTTGTASESATDQLGRGFVTSSIDDADALCGSDVLACVMPEDPYTVHFDAADNAQPYMTDWLETGLAYHEFAHVLQMTNPEATDTAAVAFGGDVETMADCFALTFLDGWMLDHRVHVSSYEYWDISIGYGYTCNAEQAQVVRDWYNQLGYHPQPISQ